MRLILCKQDLTRLRKGQHRSRLFVKDNCPVSFHTKNFVSCHIIFVLSKPKQIMADAISEECRKITTFQCLAMGNRGSCQDLQDLRSRLSFHHATSSSTNKALSSMHKIQCMIRKMPFWLPQQYWNLRQKNRASIDWLPQDP